VIVQATAQASSSGHVTLASYPAWRLVTRVVQAGAAQRDRDLPALGRLAKLVK
jgi:hypothetical protein